MNRNLTYIIVISTLISLSGCLNGKRIKMSREVSTQIEPPALTLTGQRWKVIESNDVNYPAAKGTEFKLFDFRENALGEVIDVREDSFGNARMYDFSYNVVGNQLTIFIYYRKDEAVTYHFELGQELKLTDEATGKFMRFTPMDRPDYSFEDEENFRYGVCDGTIGNFNITTVKSEVYENRYEVFIHEFQPDDENYVLRFILSNSPSDYRVLKSGLVMFGEPTIKIGSFTRQELEKFKYLNIIPSSLGGVDFPQNTAVSASCELLNVDSHSTDVYDFDDSNLFDTTLSTSAFPIAPTTEINLVPAE